MAACAVNSRALHVPGGEQLALFGPAFRAIGCAHSQKRTALLENLQAVAMLDGGNGGRLKRNVTAYLQDGGTNERLTDRLCARRSFGTAEDQEQNGYEAYLCYGT